MSVRRLLILLAFATILVPAVKFPSGWALWNSDWIEGASTFWTLVVAAYVLTVVEQERDRKEEKEKTRAHAESVALYVQASDGLIEIHYVNQGNYPIYDVRALAHFPDASRSRYIRVGNLPPTQGSVVLDRVSEWINSAVRKSEVDAWLEPRKAAPQVVLDYRDHLGLAWHRGSRGGPPIEGFVDLEQDMWILRDGED